MKVWLLQASEILPLNKNSRLMRMGLLGEELSKNKKNDITWFSGTFDHFKKVQLFDKDTDIDVKPNYHLKLIYAKGYKKNISISRIINHKIIGIKLKKMIKNMEKPDIIFASFPTIEFAEIAVKYGKKNHIPVIIDVRDLWPDIFEHNLSGLLKIAALPYVKFLDYKTKKILHDCYKVISISDLMLDWGLKKGTRRKTNLDKSFYLGYKRQIINIKNDINNIKYLFNNDQFNICFFATINNQFDYRLIADLAKRLEKDNVNIIICGNGPNYHELVDLCDGMSNVKLQGWSDINTLSYILNNSDVGLAPYKDTFDFRMSVSNKFCEYLSYGLPVIVTVGGYMKELVSKYNIGISSQDVEKIHDYIIKLKNDNVLYKKVSSNAMNLYDNEFNAEKIYPEMVKYLEDVRKEYK